MVRENRRQREMDYYGNTPFTDKGEEMPDRCIHCNSRIIKVIKKLPRTFSCSNNHSFTVVEFRENR
ncbi:MAG: hypothetical protein ACFFD4_19735 [Candidatus Odinarchaeota archaeon]